MNKFDLNYKIADQTSLRTYCKINKNWRKRKKKGKRKSSVYKINMTRRNIRIIQKYSHFNFQK